MKKDIKNLNKFTSNFIVSSRGQLDYPGMNTLIPNANGSITMKGVKNNVIGIDDLGNKKIMTPEKEYQFPGNSVYEIPLKKRGGQFKKSLVNNPKKTKKDLASKKYSRSLNATNVLFTENFLFKKPKSRKNKIFDPKAKYYAEGGESKCQPDEYWDGKKCVKLSKNVFVTSDPDEYAFRKASHDDSLNLFKAYQMQDKLMGPGSYKTKDKYKWNTAQLKEGKKKKIVRGLEDLGPIAKDFQSEQDQFSDGYTLWARKEDKQLLDYYKKLGFKPNQIMYHSSPDIVSDKIKAIGTYFDGTAGSPIYKKPIQEVILDQNQDIINNLIYENPKLEKEILNLALLKPSLLQQQNYQLQGNNINKEELELPNEEVESEYLEPGSPDTENAMEWVNKRKYNIDWDGLQIPFRLPRFRKPGSYGPLIKKGKQRYINLPTIESRNTAYLKEEKNGGESECPNGQVWSKKDKKCIDLPVFGNSLNSGTFTKLTNLNNALDIKPLNSFSDFGKIKPKKIPVVEDSFLETLEKDINDFLDNPLKKAAQVSESLKEKGEDPSDALRHSTAGALAAQTIANKTGNIPFISNSLGYLGANIAGVGHELSTLSQTYLDDRPWKIKLKESLEDIYNNSAGANTIFNNNSEKDKINYLLKLTRTNQLPDGYGEERPFRDNPKWTDPYNQKQDGGESENPFDKVQNLNEVTVYGNQEKIKLQGSLMDRLKQVKKAYNDHRVNLGLEKQKQSAEGTSSIISLKDQIQSYKKELDEEKKSYDKASKALNVLKKYNPQSYKKAKVSDVLNATGVDDLRNLYKEGKISDATFMDFYDNFGKSYDREATRTTEEDQVKLEDSWYGQPDEKGKTRWMGNPNNVAKVAQAVAIGAPLAAAAPMMAPAVVSTLANPYVAGGLNAYFGYHGLKEFGNEDSHTRKSMSRAYNDPTASNIGDAAFDVGMNSLNFVGLPFNKAIKGSKNLINNTYKINPWAFEPDPSKFYRQIGNAGLEDAVSSKIIRSADQSTFPRPYFVEGKDFEKLYSTGSGAHGRPNVIFETPGITNEGLPFVSPANASADYTPWIANMAEVPLTEGRLLKQNWLKGYKEVPKKLSGSPNNNVRIEFNPQRSNELNSISHDIHYGNQKVGEVSGNYKSNGDFEISDVGVDKAFQKKGISKQAYNLLNEAHPNNKVVSFGAYNIDAAGVQPGKNLWESLVKEGKAKRVGNSYEMLDSKNISSVLPGSPNVVSSVDDVVKQPWQMEELPGLHLQSTMEGEAISKIVDKTGKINTEQALAIIAKESGGADKVALIKQGLGETIPKKMDFNDFKKITQEQLIPLEKQFSEQASNYGLGKIGYPLHSKYGYESVIERNKFYIAELKEAIAKNPKVTAQDIDKLSNDREILKLNKNYLLKMEEQFSKLPLENQTLILGNKGKFGTGSSAHGNPEETLGHIHFLRDAQHPDIAIATQIQSDAFQGTHRIMPQIFNKEKELENLVKLENIAKIQEETAKTAKQISDDIFEFPDGLKMDKTTLENIGKTQKEYNAMKKAEIENFTQKSLLDKNHQERYLQEFMDYAGKRGDLNYIAIPKSETAAKAQGYFKTQKNNANKGDIVTLNNGTTGTIFAKSDNAMVIKHSDGTMENIKLEYVDPKDLFGNMTFPIKNVNGKPFEVHRSYSSEQQTILKKYTEYEKMAKKLGWETNNITVKGNEYTKIKIPKKFKEGKGEIKAFSTIGTGVLGLGLGATQYKQGGATNDYVDVELTPEEVKNLIAQGYVLEALN